MRIHSDSSPGTSLSHVINVIYSNDHQLLDPLHNHIKSTETTLGNNLPLVILLHIESYFVRRILIDTRSSANNMYFETWKKMQLDDKFMQSYLTLIVDFFATATHFHDITNLLLQWGPSSHLKQKIATFVTVDSPTSYNIILCRPTLNVMKAQICTFCNDMIVSLPFGSWTIHRDLRIAQTCYHTETPSPTH